MREIVHIQVGQCGNQIGAKVRCCRRFRNAARVSVARCGEPRARARCLSRLKLARAVASGAATAPLSSESERASERECRRARVVAARASVWRTTSAADGGGGTRDAPVKNGAKTARRSAAARRVRAVPSAQCVERRCDSTPLDALANVAGCARGGRRAAPLDADGGGRRAATVGFLSGRCARHRRWSSSGAR